MEEKFYICSHCGNIASLIKNAGVPLKCCGEDMADLIPGMVEAATEKHIPVYELRGNALHVQVGGVRHPMVEEHHIEWISLETDAGIQRKHLSPGDEPTACFALCEGEQVKAVYAYCNIHGLWKSV